MAVAASNPDDKLLLGERPRALKSVIMFGEFAWMCLLVNDSKTYPDPRRIVNTFAKSKESELQDPVKFRPPRERVQDDEEDLWYTILYVILAQAPQTLTVGIMGQVQFPVGHIIERFSMLFDKTPLHKASLMEEEGRTNFVRNGIFLTKPFQASSECSYLSIIYLESDVH